MAPFVQEVSTEGGVQNLAILWRRIDQPGHESARLFFENSQWHLTGTAIFADKQGPCRLDYVVICDSAWHTLSGKVAGWVGSKVIEIDLAVDSDRRWTLDGVQRPEVMGCIDLDLNFSPSTNLLPINRLGLAVGQEAKIRAAWLRFPSFALEPLDQRYRRLTAATYRYASGNFVVDLQVNAEGFVMHYPGFFQAEETA